MKYIIKLYILQMQYFIKYDTCIKYYRIYNINNFINIEEEYLEVLIQNKIDSAIRSFPERPLAKQNCTKVKFYIYSKNKEFLHRTNGPAMIVYNFKNPSKCIKYGFYKWSNLHRTNGPAYSYDDVEEWYDNNQLHRINGPAVITANNKYYFLSGKEYSESEYNNYINKYYIYK